MLYLCTRKLITIKILKMSETISLVKGQKVDLTKTNPSVNKYKVGLGWNPQGSVGDSFDLDVSAFIIGADGKKLSDKHFVFYNNLRSPNDAIVHTGDNLTGDGDGDDETLIVDFSKIEAEATEIVFVVTIHQADTKNQNFGQVRGSYIRVLNEADNDEILKFDLDEDFSIETAVEFGRLYKRDADWKFEASGVGQRAGLQSYLDKF